MKTYTIEVRMNFDDPEKEEVLKKVMMQCARHVLTSAMLIKDRNDPRVVFFTQDMFLGNEDISLLEDTLVETMNEAG